HQPCGCVLCTCEDEKQCQGCGAKFCGNRTDHPAYVKQQPAAAPPSAPVGVEELRSAAQEALNLLDMGLAAPTGTRITIHLTRAQNTYDKLAAALTPAAAPRGEEPVSEPYKSAASEGDQP